MPVSISAPASQQDSGLGFLLRLFFFGSLVLVVVLLVSLFLDLFFILLTALVSHFWPPVELPDRSSPGGVVLVMK